MSTDSEYVRTHNRGGKYKKIARIREKKYSNEKREDRFCYSARVHVVFGRHMQTRDERKYKKYTPGPTPPTSGCSRDSTTATNASSSLVPVAVGVRPPAKTSSAPSADLNVCLQVNADY